MTPGTVYTLERGAEVLGTLRITGVGGFAVQADFEPAPAFAPYRVLFDEDARLAHLVATDPHPDTLLEAEAVLDSILALNLTLRREGDLGFRSVLISIEGNRADVRPLTEEIPL